MAIRRPGNNDTNATPEQVVVRGPKIGNTVHPPRELYYDLKRNTVTVGSLRWRVSHKMNHPVNQASTVNVNAGELASFIMWLWKTRKL